MQSKKKGSSKKITHAKKNHKSSIDPDYIATTTKQKTFATIEETFEFHDHKTSTKTTHYNSKRDYLDRMEANKLSPFSSPGQSPRPRKSLSPRVVKQKQRTKNKKSFLIDVTHKAKKSMIKSKTPKNRKKQITPKSKFEFQNQFIKRMNKIQQFNQKKITQLSEEEIETSIRKKSRSHKQSLTLEIRKSNPVASQKNCIIKKMHEKIKGKYRKTFPRLKNCELKLLTAIVLIQRLWRQRKVKQMIGEFLSPRASMVSQKIHNRSANPILESNCKDSQELKQKVKLDTSFLSLSPNYNIKKNLVHLKMKEQEVQKQKSSEIQQRSGSDSQSQLLDLSLTPLKSEINLKDLELSDQLSPINDEIKNNDMIKYVDMYRQVVLHKKKQKKKLKKNKPNAFNFPQSLSQKCLLEKLYKKSLFSTNTTEKKDLRDVLLPHKNFEKSKQLISPNKPEIVELEERFYTQAQDEEQNTADKKCIVEKQKLKPEDQTIGTIGQVAQYLIQFLTNQFSEEFQAFSYKKCLKKKKKLPGIPINDSTIQIYLENYVNFVNSKYTGYIQNSFFKITPSSFLKIFRVLPEEQVFQEESEEEEEEDLKVVPSSAFFEYQPIYEDNIFTVKEENKKYSNFLSGLIKIHNKCLSDAFSEIIEKQRIDSLVFPWDSFKKTGFDDQMIRHKQQKELHSKIESCKKRITKISMTKLGKLNRKDLDVEEINLLVSLKDDYKKQGKDWSYHEDSLEIRLELSELISDTILMEIAQEMPFFH